MMEDQYGKHAREFLDKHGIKFSHGEPDTKPAPWEEGTGGWIVHHYRVELSKPVKRKRMALDFWGSKHDYDHDVRTARAYDVLSCLSADVDCPEDFVDWCKEYGYNQDSIRDLETFKLARKLARRLRAFFTEEEIEELRVIR